MNLLVGLDKRDWLRQFSGIAVSAFYLSFKSKCLQVATFLGKGINQSVRNFSRKSLIFNLEKDPSIPSFASHSSKVCQATEAAHFASSSIWLTGNGNESAAGDTAICRRDCLPPSLSPPFKKPPTLLLKCDSEATKDTLALVCSDASEATGYLITHDIPFRRGSGMVRV